MKLKVGVIGLGYWGPNFVRNFIRYERTQLVWVCDISEKALKKTCQGYPYLKSTQNYHDLLKDNSLDLIIITTPPNSHYIIAKKALEAKKHVIVAKPLALSSKGANDLLKLANENNLLLHTDLTYLYTAAVRTIKNLIDKGAVGNPLYYDSIRTNLGLIQQDVNVIWDLAIHDLSIIDYWFNLKPEKVFAVASKHNENSKTEEMAHISVTYQNHFIAHIHVSWLSPVKIRTTLVGGTNKMVYFDDLQPDEKIKIYDKGVKIASDSITPFKPAYRSGNIITPTLSQEEALFLEIRDTTNQIMRKSINYLNAQLSIRILKILEACDKSIKTGHSTAIR
ncbi:hypothetical protein A3B45_00455 [Candidatus Daviesbacteria bacterium RIFCSPLOWO2_01_FULL_39_12]|uniref:Oxidoreductase n=1 Tax=Candidatus Daviesbacteria bacterium RIFCSPLOWO2_01_FULL_39_12 TaxID=1797785 RepID=A0A1F5KP89_9BACT|nr:MAG: hypothetical protein A3D79_02855 [Candidatus Daviesbacteria bacterium RIFCSPHIGHO2_02_FULL_39_8]OGE42660.1 MAG: hypothetical protein A3B45_00455 [Candidatus Daviesbacteria bacterium RIFCSPLOWO2_01_FULL_39_12]